MEAQERGILNRASVEWSNAYGQWLVRGSINCDKFVVDIEPSRHDTFEEAAEALKNKISEAVVNFKDLITQ